MKRLTTSLLCLSLLSRIGLASVELDITPIENQRRNGFCWAYTTVALIEHEQRRRGNGWHNLSEEYVAATWIALQLTLNPKDPKEILSEGNEIGMGMDLVGKFGVVPESVFGFKFRKEGWQERVIAAKEAFVAREKRLPNYDEALSLIEQAESVKIPRPTDTFTYHGKEYTAQTFAHDRMKFDPKDFFLLPLVSHYQDPQRYREQTLAIKKALMLGYSVPLSFLTYGNENHDLMNARGEWTMPMNTDGSKVHGGHAVVIVDFITKGGKPGKIPLAELQAQLAAPVETWVIKNSWGYGENNTSAAGTGLPEVRGYPTFLELNQSYLDRGLTKKINEPADSSVDLETFIKTGKGFSDNLMVVLPRTLLRDPSVNNRLVNGPRVELDLSLDWEEIAKVQATQQFRLGNAGKRNVDLLHPAKDLNPGALTLDSVKNENQWEFDLKRADFAIDSPFEMTWGLSTEDARVKTLAVLIRFKDASGLTTMDPYFLSLVKRSGKKFFFTQHFEHRSLKTAGTYVMEFVASDARGQVIARQSHEIAIGLKPTTAPTQSCGSLFAGI